MTGALGETWPGRIRALSVPALLLLVAGTQMGRAPLDGPSGCSLSGASKSDEAPSVNGDEDWGWLLTGGLPAPSLLAKDPGAGTVRARS